MIVFLKWASAMPLKYEMAKSTFLQSSEKVQGQSLKLSCNGMRNVCSLVVSVSLKESGSWTFKQEPSPWCCTFFANAAITSGKICWIFLSSEWSNSPEGSEGSPGPSSFPSLDRSSLGLLGPLSSGYPSSPRGSWSLLGLSEAVQELPMTSGTIDDIRLSNSMPGLVPAFLEFQVVLPVVVFMVQVVIMKDQSWEFKYTVKNPFSSTWL